MAPSRRQFVRAWTVLGATTAWYAPGLWGQTGTYPQRPIKLIVPNAPGSSVDTVGRLFANRLGPLLGQALAVDNRAGAAGALGMEAGKNATPDGYTLLMASSSSMTVAPLLQKAVQYDPLKDFELITLVALLPNVLVCNPALPVATVAEFVAYARARNGKLNMASAGQGSVSHLAGVALATAAGFESLHVPYKGGSQSAASVVSGETQWTLTPAPNAMGLVQGGRLKALGHSLPKASHPLGDLPAIADALPGFEFASWIGLVAPKGISGAVLEAIRRASAKALQEPAMREAFSPHGAVPGPGTATAMTTGTTHTGTTAAEAFRAFLTRDIEQTHSVIRTAGVQAE